VARPIAVAIAVGVRVRLRMPHAARHHHHRHERVVRACIEPPRSGDRESAPGELILRHHHDRRAKIADIAVGEALHREVRRTGGEVSMKAFSLRHRVVADVESAPQSSTRWCWRASRSPTCFTMRRLLPGEHRLVGSKSSDDAVAARRAVTGAQHDDVTDGYMGRWTSSSLRAAHCAAAIGGNPARGSPVERTVVVEALSPMARFSSSNEREDAPKCIKSGSWRALGGDGATVARRTGNARCC
jgi:hypothetical protein